MRDSGASPDGLRNVRASQYAMRLELEGGVVVREREGEVKRTVEEY